MKRCLSLFFSVLFLLLSLSSCKEANAIKQAMQDADDAALNIMRPTVTFVTNGGSEVKPQTTTVVKSEPTTTRENYLFDGWYLDKNFKSLAVFPLAIEYDTTLYAKWLKIYEKIELEAATISGKGNYTSYATYNVSPSSFDLNALAERNLKLNITVTYEVYYQKAYDVLWDIGYAGAPKYEIYLLGEDLKGNFQEDMTTTTSAIKRSISMCTSVSYFENNIISLTFSTNNIQNLVKFKNITVTYECGK